MSGKPVKLIKTSIIILVGFLLMSCGKGNSGANSSVTPDESNTPAAPPSPPTIPASAPSLTYSSTSFTERLTNDGSVEGILRIEISGDTFAADVVSGNKYELRNVPTGLTASLQYLSNTTLTLTLTGQADSHTTADSISNFSIEFKNGAFVETATASSVTRSKNESIAIGFVDDSPAYYLLYSTLEFTEKAINDGSIVNSVVITLNSDGTADSFTADVTDHISASNVPSGLSTDFTRDSDTQITLTLTGNADFHGDSADITNLRIAFSDDAFTTQSASNVNDSSKDLSVYFFDIELTYSGTEFNEAVANDGSIANTITITLLGDTYSAGVVNFVSVPNVPAGLNKSVVRTSDNQLTFRLTGNAAAHASSNDITNLAISFTNGAFSNAEPANVTDSSRSDLKVNFDDTYGDLTYSTTGFNESVANDGTITGLMDITLSGDVYDTDVVNHVSATNLPVGLSADFTRLSSTVVRVELTGNAVDHTNSHDISNLGISFTDNAFTDALAANVTQSTRSDLTIDFIDISLSYSSVEFNEVGLNDGSISDVIDITLTGDTFSMDVVSQVTTSNVPAGLAASFTRDSDTHVTFSLTGMAASHSDSDDITNLSITFSDSAFTNATDASNVDESDKTGLAVNFIDVSLSYSGLAFSESAQNDGSISGATEITLAGDSFVANVSDYITVSNVPSGLTTRLTRDSDTQVTMDFIGQASLHQNANDVADLSISFSDAAFTNATSSTVDNPSQSGITIDFNDNPILTYSILEFSEDTTNDGSIENSMTIDLTGDSFDADVETNNSILVSNIPLGLTASFTRNSDTQLTFSLAGNADPHEISDSISNLTIEFLDHAFENTTYAPAVENYTRNDLQVSFLDSATVLYSASQLNESDENDGSITETLVMTLVGDTFSASVVSSNLVQAYNLPLGLSAGFTRDSDTQITLTLSGNAGDHEKIHNVSDVTIAFQDGAFIIKDQAANVTDSTKSDLSLNFYSSVIAISKSTQTCAILLGGMLKCWGSGNLQGGHGRGDTQADIGAAPGTMGANLDPAILGENRTAKSVFTGYSNTCTILDTDEVKCWGSNVLGMLGLEDTEHRDTVEEMNNLQPVDLGTGGNVSSFVATQYSHCAVLGNQRVKCWGPNFRGTLGREDEDGIGDSSGDMGDGNLKAIDFGAVSTVDFLSHSNRSQHVCAVLTNSDLKCWGYNYSGQLGIDASDDRGDDPGEMTGLPSVDLGAGHTAKAVSVGSLNTCAILDNDSLKCWGSGTWGQLGLGKNIILHAPQADPVNLGVGRTAKAVVTGNTTCVILDNDKLKCWGNNQAGQIGLGDITGVKERIGDTLDETPDQLNTIDLGSGRTVKKVTIGNNSVCAILDNDRLKCWGYNANGELGLEDTEGRGDDPDEMGDNLPFVDL